MLRKREREGARARDREREREREIWRGGGVGGHLPENALGFLSKFVD